MSLQMWSLWASEQTQAADKDHEMQLKAQDIEKKIWEAYVIHMGLYCENLLFSKQGFYAFS